jgi:hypothetical protein
MDFAGHDQGETRPLGKQVFPRDILWEKLSASRKEAANGRERSRDSKCQTNSFKINRQGH